MADKPRAQSKHISLDKPSYRILKQKSTFCGKSMNAYLKELALETDITIHEVKVHDLTKAIQDIDKITFMASGYQNLVASRDKFFPEVGLDDGEDMIRLFKKLRDYLADYCRDFQSNRQSHMEEESRQIQRILNDSKRSTYRDLQVVFDEPNNYTFIIRLMPDEIEKIKEKMKKTRIFSNDLSRYLRNLIMTKYYVWLEYNLSDADRLSDKVYAATKYGKNFITMMYHQGYECADQGRELEKLYNEVVHDIIELYRMVYNDRLILYKRFDKKIHEAESETENRHRIRRERGFYGSDKD